ncbi:TPA: carboxymuconolactone decarboxylase family protein [Serratia marcescens subsp. marcescens ATCC 13880]|uniref:CMD domain-containing protein n=1 Tax=Serratia TaxID=613 RepID=UPI0004F7B425|nr:MULTISPECIES: carboxymuconolactone decarboxylase family protein [Serratia]AIM22077.1 peroxidase-like protein [Serratia sp. SCBI]ASM02540.1 peroxidase [Serratia marcescens]MBH2555431.1 carboxymuconolactone decarboxylase family protein [Serratia ureilytica]MBH3059910.1 carboxymuconolactone decarboxylase family protein [Serratia ureilytica]MDM1842753.1 carboxymuconolactone decarboxylase family protein [Serratia ureilytica]
MERLRRQHNAQWYHETQSSVRGDAPLEPQAATLRDRFLLGLGAFADEALNNALSARAGVFSASLAGYHALFPDQVPLSRYVTLSPYDRLSTALTVAQVTGVQSLCSHYAARLAPLHSPDASRESNIRLAQITQYARQLASQPTLICRKALQQLADVGLSPADIVTFSQVIGFVSYQARVVAGVAALAGRPAVVVPGFPNVEDADGIAFSADELTWSARLPPINAETAAAEQLDVLDQSHPQARAESYYLLLAHDAATLRERNGVFNGINAEGYGLSSRLKALATLAVSRINGSRYCAATVAQELQDEGLVQALFAGLPQGLAYTEDSVKLAVMRTAAELTRAPEKFTPQSVQPLFNSGLDQAQALEVILTVALYAWENRLRQTLGDAESFSAID